MSYDTPISQTYEILGGAAQPMTAAGYEFIGPKGKRGLVKDIEAEITANMVGTTTVPEVVVGALTGQSQYARWRLGTTAILGYVAASIVPNPVRASALVNSKKEPGAATLPGKQATAYPEYVALEKAYIPADTPFFISLVPGTGGSPAGNARVRVYIDWV
jgi:hypothetical protein